MRAPLRCRLGFHRWRKFSPRHRRCWRPGCGRIEELKFYSNRTQEWVEIEYCHADRDGECFWSKCPQVRDGEPQRTGRHCPLDRDQG